MDGLEDVAHGLEQDLGELGGAYLDRLGQAGDEVAALGLLDGDVGPRHDAAYAHLELLGGLFAEEDVVPAADIADDGLVEGAARGLDALALGHAAQRDDRGLRRAAADVDDKVPVGLPDVYARAAGRGHGALDEVDLPRAGLGHRVDHRALLHAGDAAGHADEDAGLEEAQAGHALHELAQHGHRHVVVRDNAADDGLNRHYARRGAAEHLLRLLADLQQLAGELVHRHQGRLADLHALPAGVEQHAGGAHVERYILVKYRHIFQPFRPFAGMEVS